MGSAFLCFLRFCVLRSEILEVGICFLCFFLCYFGHWGLLPEYELGSALYSFSATLLPTNRYLLPKQQVASICHQLSTYTILSLPPLLSRSLPLSTSTPNLPPTRKQTKQHYLILSSTIKTKQSGMSPLLRPTVLILVLVAAAQIEALVVGREDALAAVERSESVISGFEDCAHGIGEDGEEGEEKGGFYIRTGEHDGGNIGEEASHTTTTIQPRKLKRSRSPSTANAGIHRRKPDSPQSIKAWHIGTIVAVVVLFLILGVCYFIGGVAGS